MNVEEALYHVLNKYNQMLENYCKKRGYHEISVAGYQYLMTIHRNGPLTLSQLAQRQGVTLASAAKLADVLNRKGYVHKQVNSQNHRSRDVLITPKGIALLTKQETLYTAFSKVLYKALNLDEIASFNILLKKLLKDLTKDEEYMPP